MKKNDITRRELIGVGGAVVAASMAQKTAAQEFKIPEGLDGANVSLIASAYGKMGEDASIYAMTPDIKPLVTDGKTMIGPAVTTKWEIAPLDDVEDINRYVYDPLDQAAPGSVWVIESGTDEIFSMFGDIIAQACAQNGMLGAITDNGCRDVVEIEKHGFSVFAKMTVPYGPKGLRPTGANVPITCGGARVEPDDLVAADVDGVIVIPKALIADVEQAVAVHLAFEQDVRDKVEAGETLRDAYPY